MFPGIFVPTSESSAAWRENQCKLFFIFAGTKDFLTPLTVMNAQTKRLANGLAKARRWIRIEKWITVEFPVLIKRAAPPKFFFPQGMRAKIFLNSLLFSLIMLPLARADILSTNASADTWIFPEAADNNMGASSDFAAGVNAHDSPMRALIKFDLSSIPSGAVVTSATLTLVAYKANVANATTFGLHRLLQNWGEGRGDGNQGDQAIANEATWNERLYSNAAWSIAGAAAPDDFSATASASNVVTGLGTYNFGSTGGTVADVQTWVNNPASNFGWMFKDEIETSQSSRRWFARGNGANSPTLVVNYTLPPPPPVPPAIANLSPTNSQIRFTFNVESNRTYAVEARTNFNAVTWGAVSNYSASSVATNFIFSDAISSGAKFYRVRTP